MTRFDVLGAGAGSALHDGLCEAAGLEPGCDLGETEGRPAPGSDLIDARVEVGLYFAGFSPDIGSFERR